MMTGKPNDINCPFCKQEIKDLVFLESRAFMAVYNIAPILPGHSLVMPKEHITSLFDLSDEELYEFVKFSRKAIRILSKAFNTDGFNWTLQEREEAGQSVAHMHIHIIPRIPGDLSHPGEWYPKLKNNIEDIIDSDKRVKLKPDEVKSVVSKLRSVAKSIR